MKSLVEKINESLLNESRLSKPVNTTLGRYVAWYFGVEDFDEIDPADWSDYDFDPSSLEEFFKGKYSAQYEFISDHRDEKITVVQKEVDYNDEDVEATFKVGKVVFRPVATGIFGG